VIGRGAEFWRGVRHRLDLDRPRRSWTVRLEHGIHLVAIHQSLTGDHVLVDDTEVARADPWAYDQVLRFSVGGLPAEISFVTDAVRGTMHTDLYVAGVYVRPDVRRVSLVPGPTWRTILERIAYGLAAALALAGLVGPPITNVVHDAIWVSGYVLMSMGLVAIDPFLFIPLLIDQVIEDRPSMTVAGSAIAAIAAIARDRGGLRRRIPFVRERGLLPRVLGWLAVAAVAFVIVSLA
jgi:hypothetical protein